MSITLNRVGQVEPPTTTELDSTSAIAVFTADPKYGQVVETIALANVDTANTCYVILAWNDGTNDHTFWTGTVAAGSTTIISELPMPTKTDGKVRSIKATAGAADDIWVTVISSAQSRAAQGAG